MSKIVVLLAVTSTALGLVSLHLVKELRESQQTTVSLQQQIDKLQAQQREAPSPAALPEPIFQVAPAPPNPAMAGAITEKRPVEPPPQAIAGMTREDRMRQMQEYQDRQRELMQDPEYREAMIIQNKGMMARMYPGVAKELGLDAQQTEAFFQLLAEQQFRSMDQARVPMDPNSMDPSELQSIRQQGKQIQQQNEQEIAAALGPEKLQEWKEYKNTMPARYQLDNYRSSLASRGQPINDGVEKAMLKAISDEQARLASEMKPFSDGGIRAWTAETAQRQAEVMRDHQQRTLEALSPYLTAEQLQTLRQEQDAQAKLQEAQLRAMRKQQEAQRNNSADATAVGSALIFDGTPR